jgi:hypothetical protein
MATYTFFGTTDPPIFGGEAETGDPSDYTLGFAFEPLVAGTAKAVRFYFPVNTKVASTMVWPVRVGIWEMETATTGKLLGEGLSSITKEPSSSQWVEVALSSPPTLKVGTVYVAGYVHDRLTGNPSYWVKPGYYSTAHEVAGIMVAPKSSGVPGGNGRFTSGNALTMPKEQFGETNYGVDVSYEVAGEGKTVELKAPGTGTGTGTAKVSRTVTLKGVGSGTGTGQAALTTSSPKRISYGAVTGITESEATIHATINGKGAGNIHGEVVALVQWGLTTSYTNSKEFFLGEGEAEPLAATLSGLSAGTTYHYRVTITKENGADQTFATKAASKTVELAASGTGTGSGIAKLSVTRLVSLKAVGTGTGSGTASISRTVPLKAAGVGTGNGSGQLTARRYLKAAGTGTGTGKASVESSSGLPVILSEEVTALSKTKVTLTVNYPAGTNPTLVRFELGQTTEYNTKNEGKRNEAGTSASQTFGVTAGVTYHWRAVVYNAVGSTAGEDQTFTAVEGELFGLAAHGSGTGNGTADLIATRLLGAKGAGQGTGSAALTVVPHKTVELVARGTGTGKGRASLRRVRLVTPTRRNRKPPLDLDVEVETTAGTFRLASDDLKAGNRPSNMSFSTSRGNGFANGSVQLNRQIFRDYPDVNLLDTWRFVGRQGDIAYEARLHSDPRTNSPSETLNVELVGWSSYLKSRKVSPLIIDRRVNGWQGPSNSRRGYMIGLGFRWEAEPQAGWQGEGTTGPGVVFTFTTLGATYTELGEAWLYGGGESIGALRYDYKSMSGSADANWATAGFLFTDDVEGPYVAGTDTNKTTVANQEVGTGEVNAKFALLQEAYGGAATGTVNEVHSFINPRIIGTHGLTARGESPNEGYYVSDIIRYVLNTYYPKINTEHVKENQFAIQQATWAESPVYGSELIAQLNDLTLWEENVWENRSYHYEPADLTKTDWQIRTDEPGVVVQFQGESIEEFANGVVVTYQDFSGIRRVLYPDQHSELRDPNPNNAATEHGEDLWTDIEVRWPCLEAEALQYGRAYLAEYNRPKRPGTFTINSGYIKDGAGHWNQGWKVRNSQTLSVMDHPSESSPRLITATSWDDNSKSLTITVDAKPSTFDAVVARTVLALGAHNLS